MKKKGARPEKKKRERNKNSQPQKKNENNKNSSFLSFPFQPIGFQPGALNPSNAILMRTIMDQPYPSSFSLSDAATRYVASIQKQNGDGYNGTFGLGLAVWSSCQEEDGRPVCEFYWGPGAKASGLKTIATPCVFFSIFFFDICVWKGKREETGKVAKKNSLPKSFSLFSLEKKKKKNLSPAGVKLEDCSLFFDGTVVTSPTCWDGANVFGPVGKTVVKAR